MNEHRTEHFAKLHQDFGSNLGKAIQETIEHQIDVLSSGDWLEEKIRDAADDAFRKFFKEPEFESAVHQALNDWLNKVQSTVRVSLMDDNNEKRKIRGGKVNEIRP